ncbi:ribosome biogenesis protein Nop16 [Scleroderma citrinum]
MANPRQRRKRKSSHKPVSQSKRAKKLLKKMPTIRGPKALQEAWDKTKTVRQNYLALGLQHTLNPISTGGSEVDIRYTPKEVESQLPSHSCREEEIGFSSAVKKDVRKGFGRIIRDESGRVIGVELAEEEEPEVESTSGSIEMPGPASIDVGQHAWVQGGGENAMKPEENHVIESLEVLVASGQKKARHTSEGEKLYLARLVRRYGDDYERMGRDRRLNPEQRTVGELKRAVTRAGGIEALCIL